MITTLQKNIQEEDAGEGEEDQAHEQAVDTEEGADDYDPGDTREGDETEQ